MKERGLFRFVRNRLLVTGLLAVCFCCHSVVRAEEPGPARQRVGLVLSGGGAKGVAHIGVLKVLEEAGVQVDCIAGTSMGAIIGGLYSVGYSAAELDSMVRAQDWIWLLTDQIERADRSLQSKTNKQEFLLYVPFELRQKISIPSGIMKGQGVLNKFTDLTIGYHEEGSFDSLPIPFACIAADIKGGREVVIRSGNLPLAMRTSMAVPGVFTPVYRDGMVLIDGGVFNNFPADVARDMGADILIGVDLLTESFNTPDYNDAVDIFNRITFILGEEKYRRNKTQVDLYMNPGLKGYTSADFNPAAIDTMIAMGERVARANLPRILELKRLAGQENLQPVSRSFHIRTEEAVCDVRFNGLVYQEADEVLRLCGVNRRKSLRLSDVPSLVHKVEGMDLFASVTYQVERDNEGNHHLVLKVEEKTRGRLDVGVHIDSEEVASVLLRAQCGVGAANLGRLSSKVKVNQNPWAELSGHYKLTNMSMVGVTYGLAYKDFKLMNHGEREDRLSFLNNSIELSFANESRKRFGYKVGVRYDYFSSVSDFYSPSYQRRPMDDEGYLSGFVNLTYDALDDGETPYRGIRAAVAGAVYGQDSSDGGYSAFGMVDWSVKAACRLSERVCLLPEIYGRVLLGSDVPEMYANYFGGEVGQRYLAGQKPFYGVHFVEAAESALAGCRLSLRCELAQKHFISAIGDYLIDNDGFDRFFDGNDCFGVALKYTYNSFLGPLSCTVDYSDRVKNVGVYVSLGYYF